MTLFNRNELQIGDKIWYESHESSFPSTKAGTIKDKRVLYNLDGSAYVEYKLTILSSRGLFRGDWIGAVWVVGIRN